MNESLGAPPLSSTRKVLVIAVVFIIMGMSTGLVFYSMTVFIDNLSTREGFSLPLVSLGATLSSFAGGGAGLWVARILRRRSTKELLIVGAIAAGLSISWVGNAQHPLEMCLAFIAMGVALAFMGNVPCTELLARSFHPSPGKAITIGTTGMSVGGALMPPAVLAVVQQFGMETGSIIVGTTLAGVVAIASLAITEPPRTTSRIAASALAASPSPDALIAVPFWKRVTRSRLPRLSALTVGLMIAFGLLIFSQVSTTAHLLSIARERGIAGAAIVLSIIAIVSIGARFLGMAVLTRVRLKWFALAIALIQAAAQFVYAGSHSLTTLILGSALLGLTVGNVFVLISLYVLAGFDLAEYAPNYAIVGLGTTIGAGFGPLFLGATAAAFGGYTVPLIAVGLASAAGAVVLWRTGVDSDPRARPVVAA